MTENVIAKEIVDAAFRIHTTLGPGLLESVYDTVLAYELGRRGLRTVRQQPIPVVYEEVRIDTGFRADLVVEDKVIVEIKSVELIASIHKKQLLTYLRLADKRLGLLINFQVALIKDGITRIVNGLEDDPHGRVGERATPECDPLSPRRTGQADFPTSGSPENRLCLRLAQAVARLLVPTTAPVQSAGFARRN
jgi:GxxExxY protein